MDYDVLILGGGIVGCSIAYELSKYSLNIALIEKDYDIADDVALINSAIVYDGLECEDSLMSQLEAMGNSMMDDITNKFHIPFIRKGSVYVADNSGEEEIIDSIVKNNLNSQEKKLLNGEDILKIEPNINPNIKKGLYSEGTGIICPYDLALTYGEIAFDNGVNFKLQEEVIEVQKLSKGFKVITNKNKFTCNMVINTTPTSIYSVEENVVKENTSNLYYIIIDKKFNNMFNNIIFHISYNEDREYITPSVQGNLIGAVKSKDNLIYEEILSRIFKLTGKIEEKYIHGFYHWTFYNDNIVIDDSLLDRGYIKVAGKHYAQVTTTPAVAKIVCETVVSNLNCVKKKDFIDKRREFYRFKEMTNEQRDELIHTDSKYGNIICLCEKVTEGEIVDAIRRPLGARTVEGVKRRTGVTLGSCNGAHCLTKIATILARETNKSLNDIVKDSKNSNIVRGRIKEFDTV